MRCSRRGESFAFETTLSGIGYLRRIVAWRAQGYRVSLYFLSLPSAESAIARVAERVTQGGHGLPDRIISRGFTAGIRNSQTYYRQAASEWAFHDNTGSDPVLLEWGQAE
jgi:predicted ABC-type ATPase